MPGTAAGPFAVGDRVLVRPLDGAGEVVAVGETRTIRVFGTGVSDPDGEVREVTTYEVRLDDGTTQSMADRDGQIARA